MTINSTSFKSALSLLLTVSLLTSSLLPLAVSAQAQPDSPENAANKGEGDGPGIGEGESSASDKDSDGESDEAEAEASAAVAESVSTNATAMGVDVSVEAVDTSNNKDAKGGASVSINGVTMSVAAANEAISAIAAANDKGLGKHVDTSATLGRYSAGTACDGCVVGQESGVMGHPDAVAHAEIDVTLSTQGVVGARSASAAADRAAAVAGQDLSQALNDAYSQIANTSYSGPRGVSTQGLNDASRNASSRLGTYTYSPEAIAGYVPNPETGARTEVRGGWVDQNGRVATVDSFPASIHNNIDRVSETAANNPNLNFSIDTARGTITATDKNTGDIRSYNPTTNSFSVVSSGVTPAESKQSALANAYQEYADTMTAAGQQGSNLSGLKSNDSYTYNPTTGNFVGNKNGVEVEPTNIPNGQAIADFAKTVNHNSVVVTYDATYDTVNNRQNDNVVVSNTYTGAKYSFDSRSTAEITEGITNYQSSPSSIQRTSEIDFARAFADIVAASQAINPVPTDDLEADAARMVAISYWESNSINNPKTRQLDMEVMTNRALTDKKSIMGVLSASWQFEPVVMEAARTLCNCSEPTGRQKSAAARNETAMIAAVESLTAKARTQDPNFAKNVELAKSMLNGTHVMEGLTKDQTNRGYYNFTNDSLVQSRPDSVSSRAAKAWSSAVANDRNSVTIANSRSPGIQHSYGIAPGQKTVAWSADAKETFTLESLGDNRPTLDTSYQPSPVASNDQPASGSRGTGSGPTAEDVGTVLGGVVGGDVGAKVGGWLGGLLDGALGDYAGGGEIPEQDGESGGQSCEPHCGPDQEGGSEQPATLILSKVNLSVFNLLRLFFSRPEAATGTASAINESRVAQVLITINDQTGQIELDRLDIVDVNQTPSAYTETELAALLELMEEEFPILFDEQGKVVYSNGLYSPPVIGGETVSGPNTLEYVYLVEYIDEDGDMVETTSISENVIASLIRKFTTDSYSLYLDDLSSVTYRLIDPDSHIPRDEYYDYVLYLNDGSTRAITVPQYSSVSYMKERFGQIGYKDDVLALISRAEENNEDVRSMVRQLIDTIQGWAGKFTADTETTEGDTDLTTLINSDITVDNVETLFIYPVVDVPCPDVDGYSSGFMYMAVIKNNNDPNHVVTVTDSRCGVGSLEEMALEAARDLQESYGIKDALSEGIQDKIHIYTGAVPYDSGVISTRIIPETTDTPTPIEEVTDNEDPTPSDTTLPNLTNTIVLEVKAVGSDSKILTDWTAAEDITISSGVQLYFRWSASDYQQCLPFLNDNGNYSLTRQNRAMISGDTEEEQYNIPERSGVYRLECGGQRNNEFGVDYREVDVIVR